MGSGTGFVLGGLLQGLGGGLATQAQQKREDALMALKRQYQQQDAATAKADELDKEARGEDRDVRQFERESKLKVGLLSLANQYKKEEGETEQAYKERLLTIQSGLKKDEMKFGASIDASLARIRSGLDTARDAASIRLKAQIDAGEVAEVKAADDGSTVIIYKNGSTKVDKTIKLRDARASGDDDEGGTINEARKREEERKRAAAGGGGPAPTPSPSTPPKPAAPKPAAKPVAKPSQAANDAEAIERGLNQQFPGGKVRGKQAKKGDWMNGPGGKGRAQWNGSKWIVYAM